MAEPIGMSDHVVKGVTGYLMTWLAAYSVLEGWDHVFASNVIAGAAFLLVYQMQPPTSGLYQK